MIGIVTTIIFFNWFLTWPLAYRMVTRPLDKQLEGKKTFYLEHGIPGYSVMYRQITYCSLIAFPHQMKRKFYQLTYGDFDFRAHLSKQQMRVAYYHYAAMILANWNMVIVGLHDLVFFRDSPWLT